MAAQIIIISEIFVKGTKILIEKQRNFKIICCYSCQAYGYIVKKILWAHSCSSSNATEVVAGVMPPRFRSRKLCVREYIRIISHQDVNGSKKKLLTAKTLENTFTQLSFLVSVSRNRAKNIRGAVHTQVTMQNVNLTLCFWPTHPPMKTSSVVLHIWKKYTCRYSIMSKDSFWNTPIHP